MSYIGNEPIVSATRTVTEVTATAGQTVFTANGGYTVGFLDVFINGSKLTSADFTATNGSTVTLTEAAQVSDIVRLEALGTFQAANAVLLTGNSNLTGNLNVSGSLGVGTTSPGGAYKLDITGNSKFTGYCSVNDVGYIRSSTGLLEFQGGSTATRFMDAGYGTELMRITQAGLLQFNSGYGSVATAYGCRAWVNFNGTGTVSIRASGNVSSVSDDGTGTYTINFTNAMPDANYNVVSNGPPNSTSVVGGLGFVVRNSSPSGSPSNKTTTQVQMMYAGTGSLVDASELYASVFR